jgi:hypothetical protein
MKKNRLIQGVLLPKTKRLFNLILFSMVENGITYKKSNGYIFLAWFLRAKHTQ